MAKLAKLGAAALIECLDKLARNEIIPEAQNENEASYYPMLSKADGKIDWTMPADKIDCLVRGVTPWPGAYTFRQGKLLKIHRAHPSDAAYGLPAGTVASADKNGITVCCGKGSLVLTDVQLEGKKRMKCADFLNGCRMTNGELLG